MKVRVIAEYNMKDCKTIKFNPQTRPEQMKKTTEDNGKNLHTGENWRYSKRSSRTKKHATEGTVFRDPDMAGSVDTKHPQENCWGLFFLNVTRHRRRHWMQLLPCYSDSTPWKSQCVCTFLAISTINRNPGCHQLHQRFTNIQRVKRIWGTFCAIFIYLICVIFI